MQPACKPGSVKVHASARECRTFSHHLSCRAIADTVIRPTPRHRTSSPRAPVYLVFQPIRCTASCVTTGTGELLPHLFTLIPGIRDGYFLLHFYTLADIFLLGSMVLCVARTFLPPLGFAHQPAVFKGDDGTACCIAKIVNYPHFFNFSGSQDEIKFINQVRK